jgi:hypothetical protein
MNTETRTAAALAAAALLALLAGCAGTAEEADHSSEQRSGNLRQAIEADRPAADLPSLPVPNLRQAIEADRPAADDLPSSPAPVRNLREAIEADQDPAAAVTVPFNLRQLMESDH